MRKSLKVIISCLFILTMMSLNLMAKSKPHLVFLVSEDSLNYGAHLTIPHFAKELQGVYRVTVIESEGTLKLSSFPGIDVLKDADLLVVFCRRLALPFKEMEIIKNYINSGKPVMGIRTANHAFTVRNESIPKGYLDWPEFVGDVLGCENRGYGPAEIGTEVKPVFGVSNHEILKGINPLEWNSEGNVYLVAPLIDKKADILLTGKSGDLIQPIAWTRRTSRNSKVFYTSLGYPTDFDRPQFRQLLKNAIAWALR